MAIRKKARSSSTPAEPGLRELKKSVEKLQALIEGAPIGICNTDLKGKITYANKRFEDVSGYSREEVLGKNGLKLGVFPKETVKFLERQLKSRLKGGRPPVLETPFKCKDGHWIWVALEGRLIKEGMIPVGFQLVSRDITERKEAEEALKEKREQLQKMFESVTDGISVVDLNGIIAEVNQRTVEMHGYKSRDEFLGKSAFALVAPRDHDRIAANMRRAVRRGTVRNEQYTLLRADGSEFPGELSSSTLRDASGRWIGHVTISRDITRRKQVEEALQTEKNKLQSLIDAMEYTLTIQDRDYNIIYQNEQSRIASGGDHVGEKCYRAYEKRDKVCDGCPVEKAFKDGKSHTAERKTIAPWGDVIFWENTANPIRDASGRIVSCLEIARDITERKKAEQALADEVTRRRILVDQSLDGIVVLDEDARVVEANRRFAEMLGYNPQEVLKLHTWDWDKNFPPEKLLEMGRAVDEKGLHLETKHHRKDGSVIDVDISINGAVVAGQKLIFCVCRDVTARKRAEEALKTAQEKLIRSEKLAVIGQLASGVSHELRNPLGAIKNAALYVRRKIANSELSATEPRMLEFLDLIDEEVESANKVITDLLSFSRVVKPTVSLVNAGSIIKDALNHVAVPENVKVVTAVDPNLPMVLVDSSQIRQVFINVILNAMEAMPQGGRFEIKASAKNESVIVDFADSGCGIPDSVMGRIFDPLFTTKPRGIGLGLAMSKNIMDRHGGDMGVTSKEGKGTTFTVSLPTRVV
jgi:PAS domain S-box-containing protein